MSIDFMIKILRLNILSFYKILFVDKQLFLLCR